MRKLQFYVGKQVFLAILLIILIVVGLDTLFIIIDEADNLTDKYTAPVMLAYALLNTPSAFYEYLPLSCLVGCMVGLGAMASGSELTVMRAAGISLSRLVMMILKPVILLALLAIPVGEYVAPYCGILAESIRAEHDRHSAISARVGVWHKEDDEYIHIKVVRPDGDIQGITRFKLAEDKSLEFSSYAESGFYDDSGWLLKNVSETRFSDNRTEVTEYPLQPWSVALTPQRLKVLLIKPKDMSISELYNYSQYLADQELENDRFMQNFWRKMLQPLGIIGLVLIGVSFMFGSMRSVSTGQRIVTGVVVGMVFKIVQDILGPLSSLYSIDPVWSALGPAVVCVMLGGVLLKRAG
ncbi:LPS export ABC transporter permease LptG [Amphritea balenae]|uniref:LPS export ABC transporter permease LptG n=1 Tax=Amphritea balenae TaxID=452629 RepID=A0A3P1SR94_9GAMM|nr:LPS export ABC transporter permease LptG [Amphritea balenae]RRC99731.1 LPS export ABC transporter permease LptG [Amphritea balenae]GGK79381.1 LPS export ABC transporter permease LptG [Amphritea balenae]